MRPRPAPTRQESQRETSGRGRSHLFTQNGALSTILEGPLLPKSWGVSEGSRRVVAGLRGIGPALAGKLGGGFGFRASREGKVRSLPMLAPDRSRCASSRGRFHLFTQKGTLLTILEVPFLAIWGQAAEAGSGKGSGSGMNGSGGPVCFGSRTGRLRVNPGRVALGQSGIPWRSRRGSRRPGGVGHAWRR